LVNRGQIACVTS